MFLLTPYRIYFVTYNVATKFPDPREDLHQLLGITLCDKSKLVWPDLYFIGYVQNVDLSGSDSMIKYVFFQFTGS